ncbi:MAG: 4-hydroxythreonine-4-phosphate dehydrogenase PdxA [Pseudomonadota bacterium]
MTTCREPESHHPIALTAGEPAGIGPDLIIQIAQQHWPVPLVAIADPDLLQQRAQQLNLPLQLLNWAGSDSQPAQTSQLYLHPTILPTPATPGQLNPAHAAYILETLHQGATGCLNGQYAALVTAPVHKGNINDAGICFSGHTEYLADITGGMPVMMLACPGLRVALATTHLPLSEVPAAITAERLEKVLRILEQDLRTRFGITQPNILVAGLNPHAGEQGYLGREEIDIIAPVLDKLRQEGICLSPPLPADTLFTPTHLAQADAVLAMYHDQGLPVLKHKGFGAAVNITLGLPIIRTSVDHGTALTLAGNGQADAGSLEAAIRQAIILTRHGTPDA